MREPILYDNHGRPINYLRLAVTDRCNLRCFYCMPESGIDYVPKETLLTYEEMLRLVRLLAGMGISKVRITGGEPFVRKDMMQFLEELALTPQLDELHLTTNGTLTAQLVPSLKKIGIRSVNLSLDTLDRERFFEITRRDQYDPVMQTLHELLRYGIRTKINMVVMAGKNTEDILSMAELSRLHPIEMRFIEEMPFNGEGTKESVAAWNHRDILAHLQSRYPDIQPIPFQPGATATTYQIPGHAGTLGIIAAYSRTFCGTCNRIRITPKGMLKTCLYDEGVFNVRELIRTGASDQQLKDTFLEALRHRALDGFEAEQNRRLNNPVSESMSTIGG